MNKLSISVFEKLIEKKATSKEIDFVLYLASHQNAYGEVEGVYYNTVCEAISISVQSFYDLKASLEAKGIIECVKRDYTDWDITLIGNTFPDKESYKQGYLQLHRKMFHSPLFQNMKAGAKLLAMDILRFNVMNKCAHVIGVENFFTKYAVMFQVSKMVIRRYLTQIKEFFYINISEHKYYFKVKTDAVRPEKDSKKTEYQNYNDQMYHTVLRRNRITKVFKNVESDIYKVLNIYHEALVHSSAGRGFTKIVRDSIEEINKDNRNKRKKKRVLRPKLINKLLGEAYVLV